MPDSVTDWTSVDVTGPSTGGVLIVTNVEGELVRTLITPIHKCVKLIHTRKIVTIAEFARPEKPCGRGQQLKQRQCRRSTEVMKLVENPVAAAMMPTFISVAPTMYRDRHATLPPLPRTREAIVIPQAYQQTSSGSPFLLAQHGTNDFIMFGTPDNLRLLCAADRVYMDGTFDVAPTLYMQLYSIHILSGDVLLPMVYILMASKTAHLYTDAFNELKRSCIQHGLALNPRQIMSDFESGVIVAVRQVFPTSIHKGCQFHHSQCIMRQVQQLNLKPLYEQDPAIRHQVRQLMALPFAPVLLVRNTFRQLKERANPALGALFLYFENTWLHQRTNAITVHMWNVHDTDIRTNNALEGWHHKMNSIVSRHHPTIWLLINLLRDEQAVTEVTQQQLIAGRRVRRRKRVYTEANKRIAALTAKYRAGDIDVIKLIDGISLNFVTC